nr:LytTR family DNA-binding domain-containing protein [Sphingobium boeckii]
MVMVAGVVGFLGPFGTYLGGAFLSRFATWGIFFGGAYLLVRPTIQLLRWIAKVTGLPKGALVFWGVMLTSLPMALIWRLMGGEEVRLLGGYPGMLPFTVLSALAIMAVVSWAERADAHLLHYYDASRIGQFGSGYPVYPVAGQGEGRSSTLTADPETKSLRPRLHQRLSPAFIGDILALESEDHYVRVHGADRSELVFLRLRDAIAEMEGRPGAQTHRSWWVAQDAVAEVIGNGRHREVRLVNGLRSPVARDSVDRLRRAGFLPD